MQKVVWLVTNHARINHIRLLRGKESGTLGYVPSFLVSESP